MHALRGRFDLARAASLRLFQTSWAKRPQTRAKGLFNREIDALVTF
jgi:hypothetical protein